MFDYTWEIVPYRRGSISFSQMIFTRADKIYILEEGLSTRQNCYEVLTFSVCPNFLRSEV